ncbi:hypothetical protein AB0O01_21825 [Streptomyces sp. NPDC093252]|uniref:GntT/GntP/DsdX family permease n=1 Tax=Streptomyces sp. NPDC093252 TaxID=3154980 RepID=UPI0034488790
MKWSESWSDGNGGCPSSSPPSRAGSAWRDPAPVLDGTSVALVIMAISAGSIFASHVNDGGFWIVAKYFGISERDTLKTWTVLESVLSVAGFAAAAALSLFV